MKIVGLDERYKEAQAWGAARMHHDYSGYDEDNNEC